MGESGRKLVENEGWFKSTKIETSLWQARKIRKAELQRRIRQSTSTGHTSKFTAGLCTQIKVSITIRHDTYTMLSERTQYYRFDFASGVVFIHLPIPNS